MRFGLMGAAAASLLVISMSGPALGGAEGVWLRSDGKGKVRFASCGGALCGTIIWLRDPAGPGKVGEQVFFGMQETSANHWSGSAHNPEDGRDYDGTMVLAGNRLVTQGCALGGLICKTVTWTRAR